MDWLFASGCFPPRLSATQLPSATDSQCSVRRGLSPRCWCALSGARGRAHYGRMDEVAEYVFQFNRTSEGKLLKFGAIAFSKSEDGTLARQVIDKFVAEN